MNPEILIVDDEANIRFVLSELLRREGFRTVEANDGADGLEKVRSRPFDIVILDVRMPRMDGLTALRQMREHAPNAIFLIITAHGTEKTAMDALEAGAYDYFTKPFDVNEVRIVVRRAAEKLRLLGQIQEFQEQERARHSYDRLVGQSPAMREVYRNIERVLNNDVSVLIMGESGTGKELIASAIHHNSPRSKGPFVKVNTVAIPETLLESEMFGHERGAFTGAVQQKIGKVEAAHGGTLFLDEIGDMPVSLQAKLLRVLQEREIERVGSTKSIKVDIRIICATNVDLAKAVEEGRFREDLYYRINVLPIFVPPLRKRPEDIPVLVDHFVKVYNPRLGRSIRQVSQGALHLLLNYRWPGNIRELENLLQRAMLMAEGPVLLAEHLPPSLQGSATGGAMATPALSEQAPACLQDLDLGRLLDTSDFSTPLAERLVLLTDHVEKFLIRAALEKCSGHRQETADLLGISRKSLHNKMVRYGMFDE